jgi:hypothetical protein
MARVITPSGDEVRTVYSSAGFAAGDYVFQTASGFEKAAGTTPWPVLSNGMSFNQSLQKLPFGTTSPISDLLLGPSQSGGIYSGSSFTAGAVGLASTNIFGTPNSNQFSRRSPNGDWVYAWAGFSSTQVRVYDSTNTTLKFTYTISGNSYGLNDMAVSNVGHIAVLHDDYGYPRISVFYYDAITGAYSFISYNNYNGRYWPPTRLVWTSDTVVMSGGHDNDSPGTLYIYKTFITSPTTISTVYTAVNTGTGVYFTTVGSGLIPAYLNNGVAGFVIVYFYSNNSFYTCYDYNNSASTNTPAVGTSTSNIGGQTNWNGGCSTILPYLFTSTTIRCRLLINYNSTTKAFGTAEFQLNVGGSTLSYVSAWTTTFTASSVSTTNISPSLTFMGAPPTTATTDPNMIAVFTNSSQKPTVLTYPSGGPWGAETILFPSDTASGTTPPSKNTFIDPYSGLLSSTLFTTSNIKCSGVYQASLSSPQPFAYGNSFTPTQTGTCVGVALTAASAGGTGKILTRGTAEVRSTLPNMPGALSFNHANYGTPGGIRGSVAGRTVTFEGIDG